MDFTVEKYLELLKKLKSAGYLFQTVTQFLESFTDESILLRHDVDARKLHSLKFAQIQHELGITGTYYFRMVPQSYDEEVINNIARMGHEIGYHYETMDKASGDVEKAYDLFCEELEQLRKIVPIKTVCMHGSPLSKYDNRDLWKYYDYHKLDILAEPYFDLDFSEVLYLTDTGRRWDGEQVSIRDSDQFDSEQYIINQKLENSVSERKSKSKKTNLSTVSSNYSFHSTHDIIEACKKDKLPDQIMFNFHPQRWTDDSLLWARELIFQNIKNVAKWSLNKINQ